MSLSDSSPGVGILWRAKPGQAAPLRAENRLRAIFDEFEAQGARTEAIPFCEEQAQEVRRIVLGLDAVLTWVDPIVAGRDRSVLDSILREASSAGVFVSAHPDVILKMGTKDVLVRTRAAAFGSESYRLDTAEAVLSQLPARLRAGPRVLKQHRGSGGDGVWRVDLVTGSTSPPDMVVDVRHALRGSRVERTTLGAFVQRCSSYFDAFAGAGCLIDQPYQARVADGMVRVYLSGDRVAGFGHQLVTALAPLPDGVDETPAPAPRYYFGPDETEFQALRGQLESGWVADIQRICAVETDHLPAIWDADFLLGPKTSAGEDTYVLCEINVSGVFPIPDESVPRLAERTLAAVSPVARQ